MNVILLESADFVALDRVCLRGRRLLHIQTVHRAAVGDDLRVGVIGGKLGTGRVVRLEPDEVELTVALTLEPPHPLPLHLILALPRPKVLNRTIAAAVSMGVREIDLINSWRVEKAYWNSPRLTPENLRDQALLGLEQSGDSMLPTIRLHRLFTPFLRERLPAISEDRLALLADPGGVLPLPRGVEKAVVLAIGPEGGFIEGEIQAFQSAGFATVSLGPRILRVETAIACLIGRLF